MRQIIFLMLLSLTSAFPAMGQVCPTGDLIRTDNPDNKKNTIWVVNGEHKIQLISWATFRLCGFDYAKTKALTHEELTKYKDIPPFAKNGVFVWAPANDDIYKSELGKLRKIDCGWTGYKVQGGPDDKYCEQCSHPDEQVFSMMKKGSAIPCVATGHYCVSKRSGGFPLACGGSNTPAQPIGTRCHCDAPVSFEGSWQRNAE